MILVTGATGRLGKHVVDQLSARGAQVRAMSRREQPRRLGVEWAVANLGTGAGVEPALTGVDVIVHCASAGKGDVAAARNLVDTIRGAGARQHVVLISIVGADGVRFGYYRDKLQVEEVVRASGLPWSMLRATQFYDFVYTGILGSARLPVVFAPRGFRVQPVDPRDVAERLAGVALADPAGHVTDMAGPAVTTWAAMVRDYLDVSGRRKPLVQVPVPGLAAIRDGALLPGEGAEHGERTWRQFLEERLR